MASGDSAVVESSVPASAPLPGPGVFTSSSAVFPAGSRRISEQQGTMHHACIAYGKHVCSYMYVNLVRKHSEVMHAGMHHFYQAVLINNVSNGCLSYEILYDSLNRGNIKHCYSLTPVYDWILNGLS